MRFSRLFARTLRDAPADAEAPSHRLLVRAAFVRQLMAGVYTTLPLGWRVLRKISTVVREEMDAAGAQELRMPIVVPAEPWKATGRWQAYGEEMFKLQDRHGREIGLGPTQEEVVTPLVAAEFTSYRDLPVNLYQIEWKYRDERRPRFGLLRSREFLMKDAYSFDRDEAGMVESYRVMYRAYERVFQRCGLDIVIVEADPGTIGGGVNHEFMAKAAVGEDLYVACRNGDYLADTEAARPAVETLPPPELETPSVVDTPGVSSIEAVSRFLGRAPTEMLKCILYLVGGEPVAVLVPGEREVNEKKLARLHFPKAVRPFDDDDFDRFGLRRGFVGPQGLPEGIRILADHTVATRANWVTGANEQDRHAIGINPGRDFRVDAYEDLVRIVEGDRCPIDGGELEVGRAIVVGHIYQLGTKYSEPLEATFVDEDGVARPYVMGCYGIGISRIMAAVAEQHHDDQGLIWPKALAPFDVEVVLVNRDDERVVGEAERIAGELEEAGLEVLLDDRDVAAGVKFNDADLIGIPVQVAVGRRGVEAGRVDVKLRASGERRAVAAARVVDGVRTALRDAP